MWTYAWLSKFSTLNQRTISSGVAQLRRTDGVRIVRSLATIAVAGR